MIIRLIIGYKKVSEYFPNPKALGKVKVKLYLPNYATKTNLKTVTGIDTSSFAKKVDLTGLKCDEINSILIK